jgi:hypothetical protein
VLILSDYLLLESQIIRKKYWIIHIRRILSIPYLYHWVKEYPGWAILVQVKLVFPLLSSFCLFLINNLVQFKKIGRMFSSKKVKNWNYSCFERMFIFENICFKKYSHFKKFRFEIRSDFQKISNLKYSDLKMFRFGKGQKKIKIKS